MKALELTGQRFGRLVAVERVSNKGKETKWRCVCDCGNFTEVYSCNLTRGLTKSCGCYQSECSAARKYKHGLSDSRIHGIWSEMWKRCTTPSYKRYDAYGGRGITICDEWREFTAFYEWAMRNGYSDNLTIDRKDNDGNYCPENCRWADMYTQANNTRRNVYITRNGITRTVTEWERAMGFPAGRIKGRIARGMDIERAFSDRDWRYRREVAFQK